MKKNNKNTASTNAPSFIPHNVKIQQSSGLTNRDVTKASPWGRLVGLFCFILLASVVTAQPLPPSTPSGNSVPVGGGVVLLLVALATLGIKQLRKKE